MELQNKFEEVITKISLYSLAQSTKNDLAKECTKLCLEEQINSVKETLELITDPLVMINIELNSLNKIISVIKIQLSSYEQQLKYLENE